MGFEPPRSNKTREDVTDTVESAFEENEVVLFMKGTELMPQCGYSQTALNILKQYRDDIAVVNALDGPVEAFRDELEERSGWTTLPQAYVDGEFIGGSDVLEELHRRGDLEETLDAEPTDAPF